MSKPVLGILVGALLGLMDGLSAWFSPEARPILLAIIVGSTLKGVVTGLIAGLVARWKQSTWIGVAVGLAAGFVLSAAAAIGEPDHYLEIVLPGMLLGGIVGFVTQRFPRAADASRVAILAMVLAVPALLLTAATQTAPPDQLILLAPFVGKWTGTSEGQPGKGTAGIAAPIRRRSGT